MRCPNCGNQIEDDSLFCPFCGKKTEAPAMNQNSGGSFCPFCGTYNEEDSLFCAGCGRDLLDLDSPYESYDEVPGSKNNTVRNIIIVIIAVLALAAVGGGIYWVFGSDSAVEEEEEEDRDDEEEDSDSKKSSRSEEATDEKKEDSEDQKAADKVIGYIDDIGTVNLASEAAIEKARDEYDALTDEQKELVTNYSVLKAAESEYEELKKEEEEESSMYIIPESNQRLLTSSDISGMSIKELNYARNEIYARHGRRFSSNELQTYFDSKSWYNGTINAADFDANYSGSLSDIEKKNAEFLLAQEKAKGGPYVLDQ